MNLNDILYFIELGFNKMAILMENLNNWPNILFIAIGFVLVGYWLYLQSSYPKED